MNFCEHFVYLSLSHIYSNTWTKVVIRAIVCVTGSASTFYVFFHLIIVHAYSVLHPLGVKYIYLTL